MTPSALYDICTLSALCDIEGLCLDTEGLSTERLFFVEGANKIKKPMGIKRAQA